MKLIEITQLPKAEYLVYDRAKIQSNPKSWLDLIVIIHGKYSKTVRRSTAFKYGLCEGVKGQLPPQGQGGMREGCGRKAMRAEEKKVGITVWPQQKTVDLLGGKAAVRKILNNCINQHI